MSQETKPTQVVVHVPSTLGLTADDVRALERKWKADLTAAVTDPQAKIKWSIEIKIKIGNE